MCPGICRVPWHLLCAPGCRGRGSSECWQCDPHPSEARKPKPLCLSLLRRMRRTVGWRRRGGWRRSGSGWSGSGANGSCRRQRGGSRCLKPDPVKSKPRSEWRFGNDSQSPFCSLGSLWYCPCHYLSELPPLQHSLFFRKYWIISMHFPLLEFLQSWEIFFKRREMRGSCSSCGGNISLANPQGPWLLVQHHP